MGYKLPVWSAANFSPRGMPDLIPIVFGNSMEPWVETPVAIVQIDIDTVVDLGVISWSLPVGSITPDANT